MSWGEQGSAPADVIVVGGGSAGCVLAARLSEQSSVRVLLIEAGSDVFQGTVPEDISDSFPSSYFNDRYFWHGLRTSSAGHLSPAPITQARVLGGGSSVMGMWALRGVPDDYDQWQALGARGWSWADVLPSFKAIERDMDFSGALHGDSGPIPVRRVPADAWPKFVANLAAACNRQGLVQRDDLNGDFDDGVFPMPLANNETGRVSAAQGFLTSEVRRRPNLKILPDTQVLRLIFRGRAATGVSVRTAAGTRDIAARNVVLAAGAILSPALLLHSGVGPATMLKHCGVPIVLDLKNVGRQLQNHAVLNMAMPIRRGARQSRDLRHSAIACARATATLQGPRGDINLHFVGITSPYPHGTRLGVLGVGLYDPLSRGSVQLKSGDPAVLPRVDYGILTHPSDRERLARGVEFALKILADSEVRKTRGPVIGVTPTALVRRINRMSKFNSLISPLIAAALDLPDIVSANLVRLLGPRIAESALEEPRTANSLLDLVRPMSHPTGSCAMGAASDDDAVVDPKCKVRGLANVFVVDASIMPKIPRANTCLPAMMLAEHASPMIRRALTPAG